MRSKSAGFTLIELMVVVAVLGIIVSIAVPNYLTAKVTANETNAIGTLRNLVSAQSQFRSAVTIDTDFDGQGEYGTLGEMAGVIDLDARGVGPAVPLDPPVLAATFAAVDANGEVSKSGYYFAMFLPDAAGLPVKEIGGGGPGAIDGDNCEILWCAYAWPVEVGSSGKRAFFVNQQGEVLQTSMDASIYTGSNAIAGANALAAYSDTGNGDLFDSVGLATAGVEAAVDNNIWTPVK